MTDSLSQTPHRRRNALTGEWVMVSPQRAQRPWQGEESPASGGSIGVTYDPDCYLCPGNTRVSGHLNAPYTAPWAFDNDFPAVATDPYKGSAEADAPDPGEPSALFKSEPVAGRCRVLCYHPDHNKTLPNMTEQEAWLLTKALDTNYRHLFLYQKQDKFDEFASKFNSTNKDLLNFRRDSSDVSFLKTRFTENKSNILKREKQGYFAFNVDSLKFIPYNGAKTKWKFELDKKKNELKVIGTIPYGDFWKGKTEEELVLTLKTEGTKEEVVLSWEDE